MSSIWSSCTACHTAKTHRHIQLLPQHIPIPQQRFSHIHVDLVGPLAPSAQHTHLLTIIDRTSRWPEAIPLTSTTADACATALIHHWIACFGVPTTITSDRGPQFTSALWHRLCTQLHIQHRPTTAYHPQSNGLVERFHRRLKDALRARAAAADWFHHLPWVLLSIRTTPAAASNISPAHSLYGADLTLPPQLLPEYQPPPAATEEPPLHRLTTAPAFQPVTSHNLPSPPPHPSTIPPSLSQAAQVYVHRDAVGPPLSPAYDGPYTVLARSPTFFTLQVGNRQDTVSVHRLKPVPSDVHTPSALPRPRGRPPSILRTSSSPPRPALHVHFTDSPTAPPTSPAASASPLLPTRPPRTHRLPLRYRL